MRAYKILPITIKVKELKLSREAFMRLSWMDWYFTHGKNAEATCRHYSISKSVFYRWLNRFSRYNLATLEGRSTKPHKVRSMTTPEEVMNLIISIRRADPEKSKYEIQAELKELHSIKVGYNTIQKIINRHPELQNTQHSKRVKSHNRRKVARIRASKELRDKDLGSLIQIDTKYFYCLDQRFYIFAAVDCKSRYAYCYAYTTNSSKSAQDFLSRAINYFPFPISAINTDNGSEYLLAFHQKTEQLNIPHYFSYPHTPKNNARVERFIQTLEYEFLNYQSPLPEIENIRGLCDQWSDKYNNKRFHQAHHYQTPAHYVKNILSEKGGQPFSI